MESSDKKISFSFSKISKKPVLLNKREEKKVELIDCLEGQNIKIRDAIEVEEKLLVIPLKENKKNLIDRIKAVRERVTTDETKEEPVDTRPDSELTIDELATREILRDAQSRLTNNESSKYKLTLHLKDDGGGLPPEGEIEPTLEDYEKIPISDYGLAMLRGMGWKEGIGIGKTPSRAPQPAAIELRPKGLGLGATKMIKEKLPKEESRDKDGKTLVLKKGAFAKIIAGSNKGQYCEVQGLDEESARVIVKTALKEEILTVNEYLLILVTNEEYAKYSKVLNNIKYAEYKKKEHQQQKSIESENNFDGDLDGSVKLKEERTTLSRSAGRSHSRKSDSESDSSYESQSEKYNKVHKRKDKKRHRDRSRSPPSHRYRNGKKSSKSRHRSSSSDSDYEEKQKERRRREEKHKR